MGLSPLTGFIVAIAHYNVGDLRATTVLYKRWSKTLR